MKKLSMLFSIFFFAYSLTLFAQDTASVSWPLQGDQTPVISGQVLASDETVDSLQIGSDASAAYSDTTLTTVQKLKPTGSGAWAIDSVQNNSRYIQFTVTGKTGFKFNISSIAMFLGAKGSKNIKASVSYSTDSTFSNYTMADSALSLPEAGKGLPVTRINHSINVSINPGQSFYLRVFPWDSTGDNGSTSKYMYIQGASVAGNVESLPTPASITWPLSDPSSGGTGLSPVISGGIKGDDELLNNTEINHYTGINNSQRVRIAGNAWPANQTTQIDTVFVQFSTQPKFGGKFTIDSLSLSIGASSINTMKANIYYSTDSSFATKTMVKYSTGDTSGNNYLSTSNLTMVDTSLNVQLSTGERFYIRIYPWVDNDPSVRTGKYLNLQNIYISGTTTGVTADPPTVTTSDVVNIATTFATSGGNIPTDGGSTVTARGVCWDTSASPTTANSKTMDGTGTGSFVSQVTNLTPGKTYHLRAYATNAAGTSYGQEMVFTTLDSTIVPTVTTTTVSNILVKTAVSGGNVASWGGDTVMTRGVCWNTMGNPTIADSKTMNGSGLGSFSSILYPLDQNTTYYVRAYATNSKGTGYGEVDTFKTQIPAPPVTKVVAKDGSGDYTTVQAAFDAVPDYYTGPYTIYVKNGIYKEKLTLPSSKVNVILVGQDRDSTILTYDDYAAIAGGTSKSQSVAIDADDFTAYNITFQNTIENDGSTSDQQAVALRVNGDRQAYYNCKLLGYQDTYYTWGGSGAGRIYMKDCYIEGSVDFIFGRDIVLFDSCEIHINRNGGTLTAASTDADSKFGYVFKDCKLTSDSIGFDGNPIVHFYLGRPWQAAPRTVFINCQEPANLDSTGWLAWNVTPARYAEYNCTGPGSDTTYRVSFSSQLTTAQASQYTLSNIFAKSSNPNFAYDWMPSETFTAIRDNNNLGSQLPTKFDLFQNYPNPFNPTTTIGFNVAKASHVSLKIYNILGQLVATLVDREMHPGSYQFNFNAASLSSGVYFYRINAGNYNSTKKMILLK